MTNTKTILTNLNASTFFTEKQKVYWRDALENKMNDEQIKEFELLLKISEEFSAEKQLAKINKANVALEDATKELNNVLLKHNLPTYG